MARREITRYYDDLDGTELENGEVCVVNFSFKGISYVIDLSTENMLKMEELIKPYTDAARKVSSANRARSNAKAPSKSKLVRQWARENNIDVPARGKISADIMDRFDAEH